MKGDLFMAIYDIDSINEAEYEASTDEVLDNMLEACNQMMSAIGEADRVLKNEREIHSTHGPENYSKWSTKDLKDEFQTRRDMAARDKSRRDNDSSYYSVFGKASTQGAHTRRKADVVGKELAKRGEAPSAKETKKKAIKETCLNILSVIDEL